MISVEVKSSGSGPRRTIYVPPFANRVWVNGFVKNGVVSMTKFWPRDGVAVIIRRESK